MLDYPLVTRQTPIGATVAREPDSPPFAEVGRIVGRADATHVMVQWGGAVYSVPTADDELQVLPGLRPGIFTGSAGV